MGERMWYRLSVFQRMWPYADGVRRFFVIGFAASLLAVGCGLVTPIFYKLFMEEVILRGQFDKMPLVIGGYLGTFAVGADLRELDLSAMHGRIGYVMQDNLLFNTTVRENLLLGKEDATEDELRRACKKAYILEFVQALPDGLDTVIGEKGIKLSGGQRQRLVLARLFLREVEVFILDEATSALDQYSERMVYDAMQSIPKDKTVIIVAHRESSLAICERRVVVGDE